MIESSCSRISPTPPRRAGHQVGILRAALERRRAAGRTRRRVAGAPRTWATKSSATSCAERPAVLGRGGCLLAAAGREPQRQGVREAGTQPLHRLQRAARRRSAWPAPRSPRGRRSGRRRAARRGCPRAARAAGATGAATNRGALEAVGAEVDQPGALEVVGLGERVGEGRAAVADGLAQRRAAVQVAERGVVEAGEQLERDRRRRRPPRCRARCRWARRRRRRRAPAPPSGCPRAASARSARMRSSARPAPRGASGSPAPRPAGARRARGRGCRRPRPGRARPRAARARRRGRHRCAGARRRGRPVGR